MPLLAPNSRTTDINMAPGGSTVHGHPHGPQALTRLGMAARTRDTTNCLSSVAQILDTSVASRGSIDLDGLSRSPSPENELFCISDILLLFRAGVIMHVPEQSLGELQTAAHHSAYLSSDMLSCPLQPSPTPVTAVAFLVLPLSSRTLCSFPSLLCIFV